MRLAPRIRRSDNETQIVAREFHSGSLFAAAAGINAAIDACLPLTTVHRVMRSAAAMHTKISGSCTIRTAPWDGARRVNPN
jgi:hypothetical protein